MKAVGRSPRVFVIEIFRAVGLACLVVSGSAEADPSLSKSDFDSLLSEFAQAMDSRTQPFIHRPLAVVGNWDDKKSGSAYVGENFAIMISGGLALDPQISTDALALILCHEVGHLAGVRPFENPQEREFHADHFAASYCFPRLLSASRAFRERGDASSTNQAILKLCGSTGAGAEAGAGAGDLTFETCVRAHEGALGASLWTFNYLKKYSQSSFPNMQVPEFGRSARDRFDFAQCRLESFSAGALNGFDSETVPACARK